MILIKYRYTTSLSLRQAVSWIRALNITINIDIVTLAMFTQLELGSR